MMRLGPCKKLVLFGGGELLVRVCAHAQEKGLEVKVFTAERHARELSSGGERLSDALDRIGASYRVVPSLDQSVVDECEDAIGLSFGAAWIFSADIIKKFEGRLLNLHGARLPQDRGAGGFSWQILRGNRFGFCVLHQVDTGVDTGPIVASNEFLFSVGCRVPADYMREYQEQNETFLEMFLERVLIGAEFVLRPQNEALSIYWPRISTEEQGYIDWRWSGRDVERFICAFDRPYIGAGTFLGGQEVRLRDAWFSSEEHSFHPFQAGLVFRTSSLGTHVAALGGSLLIREVRSKGGDDLSGQIRLGDRLHTPTPTLDRALEVRAVYTPSGLKSPRA